MAITLTTGARNAACDAVVDLVDVGAGTAVLRIRAGGTTVVDILLPNPAFGAAVAGVATANGLPLNGLASAAGVVDNYQVLDRDGTLRWSGVVTQTGGGGDLQVDNTNVAIGQMVIVTAWTHNAPA